MIKLFVDTDSDVTGDIASELGAGLISMPYTIKGKEFFPYEDGKKIDFHHFYDELRHGNMPKTSGLSPETYIRYFEPEFKKGNDIFYVHFSSGMSGTFNAMNIAVEQLKETYPDRKFYSFDTLGISILALSQVKEIAAKLQSGASIEDTLKYAEEERKHTACYFYANDLIFFKRSGRVSGLSAVMGTIFGIKPIIVMNEEGKMVAVGKEPGRLNAVKHIVRTVEELGDDIKNHPFLLCHCDCENLAKELEKELKAKFGDDLKIETMMLNPTSGAHCGPSAMGIAFHAKHR